MLKRGGVRIIKAYTGVQSSTITHYTPSSSSSPLSYLMAIFMTRVKYLHSSPQHTRRRPDLTRSARAITYIKSICARLARVKTIIATPKSRLLCVYICNKYHYVQPHTFALALLIALF